MSEISHAGLPPLAWHGSRFTGGNDASKGLPEIDGQIYITDDLTPNLVYIAKEDLSGWDILVAVGITGTPAFIGIQTQRAPAQSISDNTNTTINHSTDTVRYDHGGVGSGADFQVPVGAGGIWNITAHVKLGSASAPGPIYIDIENSVGAAAGGVEFDGAITDPSQDFGVVLTGQLELADGDTFNLRVYQNTGNTVTLEFYRITACLFGVP